MREREREGKRGGERDSGRAQAVFFFFRFVSSFFCGGQGVLRFLFYYCLLNAFFSNY